MAKNGFNLLLCREIFNNWLSSNNILLTVRISMLNHMLFHCMLVPATGRKSHVMITPIDRAAFGEALQRYYRIRACGPDGAPTKGRLEELGL